MKIKSTVLCGIIIFFLFIIAIFFHLDSWGTATTLSESTEQIMRTHKIPACVTAIINNDIIEYDGNTNFGEKLSKKSLFLSGGVTEILTGLSLNLLFDEKKLSPDDTISKFYPWLVFNYENKPVEITIRQLASHSSGIPLRTQDELFGDDYDGMLRSAMHGVSGSNLSFKPGTSYNHVQTDYAILAFIIEKVTGISWSDYVTENVIKPMGLFNTYIGYENVPETARIIKGSRTCALFTLDYDIKLNSANAPSKGMLTCAEDLTYLVRMLSGDIPAPEPLSKAIETLMTGTDCAYSPDEINSDAYFGGVFFSKEPGTFYLNGEMENFSTSILYNTEKKQGAVVQCSGMKAPSGKILENCLKELEEKDDFLISFISTETFNIIDSFLCVVIVYFCIVNIIAINKPRKKSYSKFRSALGIILTAFYMASMALLPFYLDYTYRMLYCESILMLVIVIGLSQIFGIINLCRLFKNRKNARKKAGYMTASGSYF